MLYRFILAIFISHSFIIADFDLAPDDMITSKWFWLPSPSALLKTIIKREYRVALPSQLVRVQGSTGLCSQEKIFLQNRMSRIQLTLQKEFGIKQPLRMAFCCSGGGNRSMIGTLGLLSGAAKSKVLDASLYVAGLSGSTWLIVPYCFLQEHFAQDNVQVLSSLQQNLEGALSKKNMFCYQQICTPALLPLDMSDDFFLEITKRYGYDQPLTLVNLFGPIVADYALGTMGKRRLETTWSSLATFAQQGSIPLPLCSSIFQKADKSYGWFEMSPFQAGSKEFGYIPVQYLGSKFKDGELDLDNVCPEYPLSFYLGMYGSAFALTVQDISNMQKRRYEAISVADSLFEDELSSSMSSHSRGSLLLNNSYLQAQLKKWIELVATERNPITYAQFHHYEKSNSTSNQVLGLFDAGIDFNMPLPLLIDRPERAIDIIIMYDSHPGDGQSLQKAYAYASRNGVVVPSEMLYATTDALNAKTMTVFNDPRMKNYNVHSPTIIYFPTKDVDISISPYITFNFKYLPEQVRSLSEKMEQAFLSSINEIKGIMQSVAFQRHGQG